MGNILGLSSAPYVIKQVDLRQEKLGISNNIPDDVLTWSHGKTAWVRLASSVNIKGSSNQAKDNVLFGSTAVWSPAGTNETGEQVPENWLLTAGFNASYPRISSYVSSSFGYRPRPGITNVDVTYLNNNGTLKKAKIKIKVYSPEQLEIIDKLYMRLGYHVLLEWGHTLYLNNDTKKVENFDLFTTGPFNEFFASKTTPTRVLNSIKEEQKKYSGNYEAFYGKIAKFNWKFNDDATYDIDLDIISQGDIIESLLLNSMATLPHETTSDATSPPSGSVSVISLKDASSFNRFLYTTYILTAGTSETYTPGASRIGDLSRIKILYNIKKWEGKDALILPFAVKDRPHNKQVFIPLGFLLAYLESNQNLFLSKDDPHLFFDVEDSNYCLTFDGSATGNGPYHVSSDPRICVIPNAFMKNADFHTPELEKFYSGISTIGRVMYIHYNIDYLAKLLLEIRDEKGKVVLGKFLDTILADANRCLGGVNKLTYKVKDDNIIYIVDEAPLDYGSLKSRSIPASFNVFGIRSNQGSFVKNIDFNVTITNDMATTITIGAQANGNQISQNSTALSNFNAGLIDRTEEVRSTNTTPEDVSEQNKQIIELGNRFEKAVNSVYNNNVIDSNVIENLVNVNSDLANHIIGRLTDEKRITAPSFLPFDLNLTMVGLSGMKIFERFILTPESEKILPSTYRDNNGNSLIDFLITDLSHKISNNTWETNIKGKTIPAEIIRAASPTPSPDPSPSPNPIPSPVPDPVPQPGKPNPAGVCGAKSLSPVPPPIGTSEPTSARVQAMTKSFNAVFKNFGAVSGMCAQWTYNLALNYIRVIRNNNNIPQKKLAAGGNANQNKEYWNNLVKLGYTQTKVGSNISKSELRALIDNTTWNYGDVIVYYANDGKRLESHVRYGHTQIYVGNLTSSKWSTSTKNNYGASFVYGNRKSNCWDLYIFRSPIS